MTFEIEYNSERSNLIIPEYGRHIQKLVDHCVALEDAEERNKMAKSIVNVMGNLQPHLRDVPDFKHKLWDQLFIISDFKLEAESPYPKPSKEELSEKPESLPYPKSASKYRFYGNNIQTMIDVVLSWEEGEPREGLTYVIANHMKKCYLNWNKDTVDDRVIFNHLFDLTNGEIDLRENGDKLADSELLIRKKPAYKNQKTQKHSGHHKNQKNYRKKTR
jgi:hypothetical protein|tara:strand:+ start:1518 stop:2171 length:654 start_codon:yes stop_codon:yes gene_type:complete